MQQRRQVEIDVGYAMRIALTLLLCTFLVIAPVSAQGTPTAQAALTSGDVTPAGLLVAVVAVIGSVFAFLGTVGKSYVDNWFESQKAERAKEAEEQKADNAEDISTKQALSASIQGINTLAAIFTPMMANHEADQKAANEQRVLVTAAIERSATAVERSAQLQNEMWSQMKKMDTSEDAADRQAAITSNSDANTKKINAHTDEVQEAINKHVDKAADDTIVNINLHTDQRLEVIEKDLKSLNANVATIASMHSELEPIRHDLERALLGIADLLKDRAEVQKKIDTNRNLNPQIAIDAEKERGIHS